MMRRLIATVVLAVTVTGCHSEIVTTIDDQRTSVTLRVDPAGRDAIIEELGAIEQLFQSRTGSTPVVGDRDGTLTVNVDVDPTTLPAIAGLTGVAAVTMETVDDTGSRISVTVTPPAELLDALRTSVADEPDRDALAVTAATMTDIVIVVAGQIVDATFAPATGTPVAVAHSRTHAELRGSVHNLVPGTFIVTTAPDSSGRPWWRWLLGLGVATTIGLWLWAKPRAWQRR